MEMDAAPPAAVTFYDFLEKMRNPAALHLVRSIKSFIVSFSFYAPNPDNDGKRVQEFFATMEAAISDHPLWAGSTDEEIDCAVEGLEKYVMTKLFSRTFAASSEDVKIDNEVSDKIQLLQTFLRPEHLDIPEVLQNETSWLLAEKELLKINSFKAPREKLQCIMSCCRVINNLLLNASMSENRVVGGADDFLPVLIYVTIKANPPQLHSNLRFIQLYRRQTKLVSEAAYFFTSLVSAKTFILELNASSLSIDEIEFEESMQQARSTSSAIQKEASAGRGEAVAPEVTPHFGPSTPMNGLHTNITNRSNFPYMDTEPGQLTVEDVPRLLSLYKDVVTRYTNLRNAMGLMTISRRDPPRPISRQPDETSLPQMEQTDSISSSRENTEWVASREGSPTTRHWLQWTDLADLVTSSSTTSRATTPSPEPTRSRTCHVSREGKREESDDGW